MGRGTLWHQCVICYHSIIPNLKLISNETRIYVSRLYPKCLKTARGHGFTLEPARTAFLFTLLVISGLPYQPHHRRLAGTSLYLENCCLYVEWSVGWMDGWSDGRTDGRTDGLIDWITVWLTDCPTDWIEITDILYTMTERQRYVGSSCRLVLLFFLHIPSCS